MDHQIKSDSLTVVVSDQGGELRSIRSGDGLEYLWQGGADAWPHRAPNLFPFIGRFYGQRYRFRQKEYPIGMHGFVWTSKLTAISYSDNECIFELSSTSETEKLYPFRFIYRIQYWVEKDTLSIITQVTNTDSQTMFFAVGGHPSFRVPLEEGLRFEDHYLEFGTPAKPRQMELLEDRMYSGRDVPFPLKEDRRLDLDYALFDQNALVLRDMAQAVTLKSDKSSHGLEVRYPDMRYLGIWTSQKQYLPYLCIEPWSSMFGREKIQEEISTMPSLVVLSPGNEYQNEWSIRVF